MLNLNYFDLFYMAIFEALGVDINYSTGNDWGETCVTARPIVLVATDIRQGQDSVKQPFY